MSCLKGLLTPIGVSGIKDTVVWILDFYILFYIGTFRQALFTLHWSENSSPEETLPVHIEEYLKLLTMRGRQNFICI